MRRRKHELQQLNAELERVREKGEQVAAYEERAQIFAEVHAELAAALGDIAAEAERAEQPAIRSQAVLALGELQRLYNLTEDVEQPTLADLPALIERVREAGVPVTLHDEGEPRSLPVSLERSVYRVVEAALTNVQQHAPGAPATVRLIWRRTFLGLQIRDTGSGQDVELNPAGVGLVVMRERIRLHGGELRTRSISGGGFEVLARLPL